MPGSLRQDADRRLYGKPAMQPERARPTWPRLVKLTLYVDVYARLFPVFTYSRVPSLAAIALASGAFGPKASVVLGAACALTTVVITASCRRSFAALAAS